MVRLVAKTVSLLFEHLHVIEKDKARTAYDALDDENKSNRNS